MNETDRIERTIVINTPRERVWQALSDAEKFGTWFGAKLDGQAFTPGKRTRGQIATTPCRASANRAKRRPRFSRRWATPRA